MLTEYEFVDIYLSTRYLNKETVQKQIKSKLEDKQKDDITFSKQKNSSFSKLKNYYYLEDSQIYALLKKLKEELNDNIYSPNKFGDIIQSLISLNEIGFKNINYTEYITPMKNQLKNNSYSNELLNYLQFIDFDNPKDKKLYYNIIQPLINIIYSNNRKNIIKQYSFINNTKEWDAKFVQHCSNNIELFIKNNAFFYYIDIENMLKKIKNASLSEIYNLSAVIRNVYIYNNHYRKFRKDRVNLKKIFNKLTNNSALKTNTITRKRALNDLITTLKDIISKLDTMD